MTGKRKLVGCEETMYCFLVISDLRQAKEIKFVYSFSFSVFPPADHISASNRIKFLHSEDVGSTFLRNIGGKKFYHRNLKKYKTII